MENARREFLKKMAVTAAGVSIGGAGFSAKSYNRIIGANDRVSVMVMGCGRRVGAFKECFENSDYNAELTYICDVMKSKREDFAKYFEGKLDYKPKLINDFREALDDKKLDAVINATPDHWHAPGTWIALEAGKNVYVEKPCSHNPYEGELLVAYQKKYGKFVQMGNQQRSSVHTIEIMKEIHNGLIGTPYKAVAFYNNCRGSVPLPVAQAAPEGLDWDLFQGPAPREEYRHDTWNYNWHWYGWKWGTAETGNNATHELDIARWALQVGLPESVYVEAAKRHYLDDGWEMYDTMDATFKFAGNKVITWDGKSRNSYSTYGGGRGTIIYGSEGTLHVDRGMYKVYDRCGKLVKEFDSNNTEQGTALGGGGTTSTKHVVNFYDAIRGKSDLNAPIDEGAKSVLLCHLANISSRINKPLEVDSSNGHIKNDEEAMKLWKREYEPGWEPKMSV